MKKLVIAAAMLAATSAFAEPILLPGGVSVPNPATSANGSGNVNNGLNLIQYYSDINGDIVNIGDLIQLSQDQTFANTDGLVGLNLEGYGIINNNVDTGDLLCPSCQLVFEFGGLEIVEADDRGPFGNALDLSLTQSYFNVWLVDSLGGATPSAEALLRETNGTINQGALDDFIDDTSDTLFLSGSFVDANYNAETNGQVGNVNVAYFGGIAEGELTTAIDIADEAPGEGIANGNIVSDSLTRADFNEFQFVPGQGLVPVVMNYFDAFAFSVSASFFDSNLGTYDVASGNSGDLTANVVSAPATVGLFGLALMGMGLIRRNKNA